MSFEIANSKFIKLTQVDNNAYGNTLDTLLIDNEYIIGAFKTVRDGVVFTNKRIMIVDIQGVIGKKKTFITIPYKNISAFSIETAGVFDLDSKLDIWVINIGNIVFEFLSNTKIKEIYKTISIFAL